MCTCWWTSVIDIVKWRNTLIVDKTTAPFAWWSLSSSRFIMSKISLLSDGRNFDANSRTRHCAHSLNSLILCVKTYKKSSKFTFGLLPEKHQERSKLTCLAGKIPLACYTMFQSPLLLPLNWQLLGSRFPEANAGNWQLPASAPM